MPLAYYIDDFTDPWKNAPILLLLHAAMGSARRYYAWVPPLSRHYRVVRMDLRGHGSSPVPPADRELTLERLVRDVAELMDHLGCASAHIVGNSAGGYLGQQLAMTQGRAGAQPDAVRLDPGPQEQPGPELDPADRGQGSARLPCRDDRRPAAARQVDPGLVEWFLDEAARNDPAYIGKFVLLMARYDWSDQLGHIACPTLVVVPGAEPIGSTANYEPFRQHVRDVEMRVYDGAPHNICDAFPDRCAGDVLDFLGRRFGLGT